MFRFIVRRLLQLIPTLFGLSLLLFVWLHRLPGGPETAILGERGTPETAGADPPRAWASTSRSGCSTAGS